MDFKRKEKFPTVKINSKRINAIRKNSIMKLITSQEESLVKLQQIDDNFSNQESNFNDKYELKENFLRTIQERKFKVYRRFVKNDFKDLYLYYTVMRPKKKEGKRIKGSILMIHGWFNSSKLYELSKFFAHN